MTNVNENIDWLIQAIKAEEVAKLNMAYTVSEKDCGTVACIYGFAVLKEYGPNVEDQMTKAIPMADDYWDDYFGLGKYTAKELFFAYSLDDYFQDDCLSFLTKDDAILALNAVRNGTFETWLGVLPKERMLEIEKQIEELYEEDDYV